MDEVAEASMCERCKVRYAYEPEGVITDPKLCMNCMYDLDEDDE